MEIYLDRYYQNPTDYMTLDLNLTDGQVYMLKNCLLQVMLRGQVVIQFEAIQSGQTYLQTVPIGMKVTE